MSRHSGNQVALVAFAVLRMRRLVAAMYWARCASCGALGKSSAFKSRRSGYDVPPPHDRSPGFALPFLSSVNSKLCAGCYIRNRNYKAALKRDERAVHQRAALNGAAGDEDAGDDAGDGASAKKARHVVPAAAAFDSSGSVRRVAVSGRTVVSGAPKQSRVRRRDAPRDSDADADDDADDDEDDVEEEGIAVAVLVNFLKVL